MPLFQKLIWEKVELVFVLSFGKTYSHTPQNMVECTLYSYIWDTVSTPWVNIDGKERITATKTR